MNTNTIIGINKLNLNALKPEQFNSKNKILQDGEPGEKIVIPVPFDGYNDITCEVKTLASVIECLSMDSCRTEKENLEMISSVSRIIQKIIPDVFYLDDLIFNDESSRQNFKPLKDIE